MDKVKYGLLALLFVMFLSPLVSAGEVLTCYYDGKQVPCDETFTSSFLTALIVALPIFIVWLWLLIDCLRRDFKDKAWWVVIFFILGIFGAILYFFLVKRNPENADGQLKKPFIFWIGVFIGMFVVWWILTAVFRLLL